MKTLSLGEGHLTTPRFDQRPGPSYRSDKHKTLGFKFIDIKLSKLTLNS
jgi:hypothetical protein